MSIPAYPITEAGIEAGIDSPLRDPNLAASKPASMPLDQRGDRGADPWHTLKTLDCTP
jgi:hypothetical protein